MVAREAVLYVIVGPEKTQVNAVVELAVRKEKYGGNSSF